MLDPYRIPTPLIQREEYPPVPISGPTRQPRFPSAIVVRLFVKHHLQNLWNGIRRRRDPEEEAVRLRKMFETLGGLWIKVGQLLSLRTDVFSRQTCRELGKLQFRSLGFPLEEARMAIETELGMPLEKVFKVFESAPIAAASVSQVHRAVLHDGETVVAVKVLRPHVEVIFERDLRNLSRLIWVLEILKFAPHVHWRKALYELEMMVVEELDLRYEAANMRRMKKSLREHNVYVPKVYVKHSTRRLLVSEFIPGVLMSDFIGIGHSDPERLARWCQENRVQPEKFGRRLFNTAMRQLLEDNLFHADLHPGNIMILKDNRMALIDFGTIGSMDHTFLLTYKGSLAALAEKDFLRAADMFLRLTITPPGVQTLNILRTELVRTYRHWEGLTHLHGLSYHERSLASAGADAGRIMFKHKIQLTWAFMRVSRTWGTLDASLSFLMPDANYMRLFNRYFKGSMKRKMQPRNLAAGFASSIRKTMASIEEYNDMLGPMIRKQIILSPNLMNASEMIMRFMRTAFKVLSNVIIFGAVGAALLLLHRFHPEMLIFESEMLHALADDDLTTYEIWWLGLGGALCFVLIIRRALRSVDKGL